MKGKSVKKVLVIGGGASGMAAAIAAARNGAGVEILEHNRQLGRKILSTGNGKCNYTNSRQGIRCYRGENPAFALPVFGQFGFAETVEFMKGLGIFPKERDGYFYPASGQAVSVQEALRMELRRLGVRVALERGVTKVRKRGGSFEARAGRETWRADRCIFACGGLAFAKSGSDGSAFSLIEELGHTFIEPVPALVQLRAKQDFFASAAGVRTDGTVTLYVEGKQVCSDRGEIQLTESGISGIPAFQVSRYAARALSRRKKVWAALDFAPYLNEGELYEELQFRFSKGRDKTAQEALVGLFPQKLILLFLKQNHIALQKPAGEVSNKTLRMLCGFIKRAVVDITGTKGFDAAQATAGGVDTAELCPDTLESYLVPGLYFAGEVIDIDGMCGGYNLQWAWSSGYVAGMHAALD